MRASVYTRSARVLVVAYECDPYGSHAPRSAWEIISRLSKFCRLWIVTEENQYRHDIDDYLSRNPDAKTTMNFIYVPRSRLAERRGRRPILPLKENIAYIMWERRAYSRAVRIHRHVKFDIVHHLRSNSFREPGVWYKLSIPVIWGPVGGTTIVPKQVMQTLEVKSRILHVLRSILTTTQLYFDFRIRRAVRSVRFIIAQTRFDQEKFTRVFGVKPILLHEQAAQVGGPVHRYTASGKLKVAWVGQCVARKALPLLLRSIAADHLLRNKVELHIAGDGPFLRKWMTFAQGIGVGNSCRWYGWLSQKDVTRLLDKCHIFAFTSILEATSTAVMQAISSGLPIVCLKHCGFGDIVDDSCGITIPLGSEESVIEGYKSALLWFLWHPDAVQQLSSGALRKAEQYSWDRLAQRIMSLYEEICYGEVNCN